MSRTRAMPGHPLVALLVLMLGVLVAPKPAFAQGPDTLTFIFVSDVSTYRVPTRCAPAIAESLRATLELRLPCWAFRLADAPEHANCVLRLKRPNETVLQLELFDRAHRPVLTATQPPSQFLNISDELPNKDELAHKLALFVREDMFRDADLILAPMAASIPLASLSDSGPPDPAQPALPLAYEHFREFAPSTFVLSCEGDHGDLARVYMNGTGGWREFGTPTKFNGVGVTGPEEWLWGKPDASAGSFMTHAEEFRRMRPCSVMIQHVVRRPDTGVDRVTSHGGTP